MDGTVWLVLARIPAMVLAIVCHEVAHGWVALLLGDPTAREHRRLSFNPLRHIDPFGTVILPGALALAGAPAFGWAKPVPVNKWRLRNPRFGMMAVALAGPAMNLLLAGVGAIVLGVSAGHLHAEPGPVVAWLLLTLQIFILGNIVLALFNLLPIPPLDGSHIVEGLLPGRVAQLYAGIGRFGPLLLIGALMALMWLFPGTLERSLLPPVVWVNDRYMALAQWIAGG